MTPENRFRQTGNSAPGLLAGLAVVGAVTLGLIILFYVNGAFVSGGKPAAETASTPPAATAPAPSSEASTSPAAPEIAPATPEASSVPEVPKVSALGTDNVLAAANGGHMLAMENKKWLKTIDGDEKTYGRIRGEGVYAFKDDKPATFDAFTVLTKEKSRDNLKQFELFVSSDSPDGPFKSVGVFQAQNAKFADDPHQVFKFQKTTAKYFKVKILSSYGPSSSIKAYEFQLIGRSEE